MLIAHGSCIAPPSPNSTPCSPPSNTAPSAASSSLLLTPRFTITNAITADLTAIERARGFLEAATLSEAWVERMSQRALLLEAHYTTHIEGAQLSMAQAETAWAGGPLPEARADDVRELLNYRAAFQLVSEYLNSGEPVTEGLIREIHKRLVEGVRGGEGGPGTYRLLQNFVAHSVTREVIYTPPPPIEVPGLMQELVAFLRAESAIHPVLMAGLPETSRRTLQRDLKGMLGKGLLREVGAGATDPNRHYEPGKTLSG